VRGYGVDRDTMVRGLSSVAVPVLRDDGALALVLSAIGLTSYLTDARLAELAAEMQEIAKSFSHMVTLLRD
jgi:DNA-binding IclR family transcriptional regulator